MHACMHALHGVVDVNTIMTIKSRFMLAYFA